MTNYKRKYQYPIEFITKKGTLNKNKKRKVNEWIQDMKNYDMKSYTSLILEWGGVISAIIYSLLVALNIGAEFIGFSLLLFSAILLSLWAIKGNHRGIFLLNIFYAIAAIIGIIRWYG